VETSQISSLGKEF